MQQSILLRLSLFFFSHDIQSWIVDCIRFPPLQHYTEKADVWSFGVVLWELVTRLEPYGETTSWQVAIQVAQRGAEMLFSPVYMQELSRWPPTYVELLRACLELDQHVSIFFSLENDIFPFSSFKKIYAFFFGKGGTRRACFVEKTSSFSLSPFSFILSCWQRRPSFDEILQGFSEMEHPDEWSSSKRKFPPLRICTTLLSPLEKKTSARFPNLNLLILFFFCIP